VSSLPRVLVVDDDRRFRAAVVDLLEELGCAPEQVSGAQQALRALEADRYDLVLMDLRMPGLSGHDLLRRLERGVPVVAMSGTGTMDDVIAVLRRGAVDFLRKPFEAHQLQRALRRALGDRTPEPQGTSRFEPEPTGPWVRPPSLGRPRSRPEPIPAPKPADRCGNLTDALADMELELPVIAPIAESIRKLLRDPGSSVEAVVSVVQRDPTISAVLIKLANSSLYGGQIPATGLRSACLRLGTRRALGTAHQVLVRALFDLGGELQTVADGMWRNTAVTAFVARELGTRIRHPDPEELHLAAMLHNLGELVLLRAFGQLVGKRRCPEGALQALATRVERSHEDVGRRLIKSWGMPSDLVLLAGAHHRKPWRPESKEAAARRQLVVAAWSGAWHAGYRYLPGEPPPEPDELLQGLGLERADLDKALAEAERWLETAAGEPR
jgi:HD-like signal output (HDOD) protein/CheY-like chemotaxis protein